VHYRHDDRVPLYFATFNLARDFSCRSRNSTRAEQVILRLCSRSKRARVPMCVPKMMCTGSRIRVPRAPLRIVDPRARRHAHAGSPPPLSEKAS